MCQFKIGERVTIRSVKGLHIHVRHHGEICDHLSYPVGQSGVLKSEPDRTGCVLVQLDQGRQVNLLWHRLQTEGPLLTTQERVFARMKLLDERFEQRKAKKEYDKPHPALSVQAGQCIGEGSIGAAGRSPYQISIREWIHSTNF